MMQLLDAAQMGWWKADFRTGELFFSDYIVDLLGLGSNRAAVGELMPLTREDYRTRIHNEFLSLKVGNHFDETFPSYCRKAKYGSIRSSSANNRTRSRASNSSATSSAFRSPAGKRRTSSRSKATITRC
ncbi:MAG: hypothetical protein ACLRM8_01845 [Alistipes sp.]